MGNSNNFKLIFPKPSQGVQVEIGGDVTLPCHLSPAKSAVDMEIKWFKNTECVFIYENKKLKMGQGYMDRVGLVQNNLKNGNVSLTLTNSKWSDIGDYLCQVTSGDRTEEITIRVTAEHITRQRTSKKLLAAGVVTGTALAILVAPLAAGAAVAAGAAAAVAGATGITAGATVGTAVGAAMSGQIVTIKEYIKTEKIEKTWSEADRRSMERSISCSKKH